jgi:hypothetical protein
MSTTRMGFRGDDWTFTRASSFGRCAGTRAKSRKILLATEPQPVLRSHSGNGVACPLVLILGVFGRTPMSILLRTLHSSLQE